jgi:hypothetical protein
MKLILAMALTLPIMPSSAFAALECTGSAGNNQSVVVQKLKVKGKSILKVHFVETTTSAPVQKPWVFRELNEEVLLGKRVIRGFWHVSGNASWLDFRIHKAVLSVDTSAADKSSLIMTVDGGSYQRNSEYRYSLTCKD